MVFMPREWEVFKEFVDTGDFPNMGSAVKKAIEVARSLQDAQEQGLRSFVAEDPRSGERMRVQVSRLDAPLHRRKQKKEE